MDYQTFFSGTGSSCAHYNASGTLLSNADNYTGTHMKSQFGTSTVSGYVITTVQAGKFKLLYETPTTGLTYEEKNVAANTVIWEGGLGKYYSGQRPWVLIWI